MPTPRLAEIPVRTPAELTCRWADLLAPPTFAARSLWLAWVDADGLMPPLLVPVDDVPAEPDPLLREGLIVLHEAVVDERLGDGGHLALALCRPGRPGPTGDDERWADVLRATLGARLAGTWSLHLAAGGRVTPLVDPPWWRPA